MKTVHQSLIDYEMGQLRAVAECRAVPLATSKQAEAVEQLAAALLSPASTAIVLADLSKSEKEALQCLVDQGGQMEGPRFTRQYGLIRPMGLARLERERPWQNPANPAEGLWYKGLIFKAFQITAQGSLEIFYIPDDLLPLLQSAFSPQPAAPGPQPSALEVTQMPPPALIVSGTGRLRENIFSLLVYLQTTPVRLQNKDQLAAKDKESLANCLLPPLLPTFTPQAELDFLLHLAERAGLLLVKHGRLRPDRDPTRAWLQVQPDQQVQQLQNTWRGDPTWNDLWHVPGLVPQPTGWENSPLLARSKILGYLSQLEASPEGWFLLDDFVAVIKGTDPDFQRPGGDYDSWYIQDSRGHYLMGFDSWDKVEGVLIRYLLTHLLPVMGVVDLGLATESSEPTSFRITTSGAVFLSGQSSSASAGQKPLFLRVDNNFCAHVPARASLYDRFQLARFAKLDRREKERAVYRITQASVSRAMRNGVTVDQIVAFLARATNNQTPLKVVETLRTWGARWGTAQLEQATLLHLKHERLVAEVKQHPTLGPLLGEVIGPKTVLIPPNNVQKVRRLLTELGYLEA